LDSTGLLTISTWTGIISAASVLMTVLILLGLAMSAFVRWRIGGRALVLAVSPPANFGAVINNVNALTSGYYLDLQYFGFPP